MACFWSLPEAVRARAGARPTCTPAGPLPSCIPESWAGHIEADRSTFTCAPDYPGRCALTQMTSDGMASDLRRQMTAEAVAPVLTALASEECRLNGEYIVTGGGLLRRASAVEWGTVRLPDRPELSAAELSEVLAESRLGEPREFGVSADAFTDLARGSGRRG